MLHNLILLKNIQKVIFFPQFTNFNCNLMNAFSVLFNSIEKYVDGQKHTLENTPLFILRKKREKFTMEYEIYEV